jgi:hypothetical protein
VKVPLLISGLMVSAFLTLSATSQAAPRGGFGGGNFRGGNFRGGNFRGGRNFAFNHQNRRFFRRDRRVFFQQPIWPLYWGAYSYPDDYSYLDNGPDNDFQYADNSAAFVQPETSRSAVSRDPIVIVVNTGNTRPIDPSPNPAYIPSGYTSTPLAGQQRIVNPDPIEQIGPQADPGGTVIPPGIQPPQTAAKGIQTKPPTRPGPFGNLVLVSWLEDAGKDVIYVQNTDTQDVQKITSEPNLDHFRIVELHPNADPKLFEAVISNGSQQGAVRFGF